MADVAQLVRALVCGTGGRGFEPHHSPHNKTEPFLRSFLFINKTFCAIIYLLRPDSSVG